MLKRMNSTAGKRVAMLNSCLVPSMVSLAWTIVQMALTQQSHIYRINGSVNRAQPIPTVLAPAAFVSMALWARLEVGKVTRATTGPI